MKRQLVQTPAPVRPILVLIAILALSTFAMARQDELLDTTRDVVIEKPADEIDDVFVDDNLDQDFRQKPTESSPCRCRQVILSEPGTSTNPMVITMEELEKNPDAYYGKNVTVDGEMHRTFTDSAFTIEDGGFFRDRDVLVISTVPMSEAVVPLEDSIDPGNDVQVTGLVQPYDLEKLESAYGPLHLESREGPSFTKNPVLIVDRRKIAELEEVEIQIEKSVPAPELQALPPAAAPRPVPEPTPAAPGKVPEALPKTAGDFPLLGLIGLLALSVAFVLRRFVPD